MAEHQALIDFNPSVDGDIDFSTPTSDPNTDAGVQDKVDQTLFVDPMLDEVALRSDFENGDDRKVDQFISDSLQVQAAQNKVDTVNVLALSNDPDKIGLIQEVINIPDDPVTNGRVRAFAKKITAEMALESMLNPEPEEIESPQEVFDVLNIQEEITAKNLVVKNWVDQQQALWNKKNFLGKIASTLYSAIPLVNQFAIMGVGGWTASSLFVEDSVRNKIEEIMRLPLDQMEEALSKTVDEVRFLGGDFAAYEFSQKFKSYTSLEGFADNVFLGLDVIAIVPTKVIKEVAKVSSRAATSVLKFGSDKAGIANDMGHAKTAAILKVSKQEGAVRSVEEISDMLPSTLSVASVTDRLTSNSNTAIRKLSRAVLFGSEVAVQPLSSLDRVALANKQFSEIKEYLSVRDSLIDMITVPAAQAGGTDKMILKFGTLRGEKFASERGANSFIKRNLKEYGDAKAVKDGDTWEIVLERNIKHGEDLQNIKLLPDQITPEFKTRLGRILSSDGTKTSKITTIGRRSSSSNMEKANQYLEDIAQPLLNLKGKERNNLEEILSEIALTKDPKTKERRFLSPGEFELRYNELYNSLPSNKVQDAYEAYRDLSDLDYVMNAGSILASKNKLGVEKITLPGGEQFQGIQRKSLRIEEDSAKANILVLDKNGKIIKRLFTQQKILDNLLKDNWVLMEAHDGLVQVGDNFATHILTKDLVRNNLRLEDALGYNPGGHLIYKKDGFIKQADVRISKGKGRDTRYFVGDKTIANVGSEKQGLEIVEVLEEARRLHNLGDEGALKKHMEDYLPDFSKDDWARVNKDVPFEFVRVGKRTIDNPRGTLDAPRGPDVFDIDTTTSRFNTSSQLRVKFAGEQEERIISQLISEQGVISRIDQAEVIRPLQALQIGLRNAVDQSTQMAYVIKAAEDFQREFSKYMVPSSQAFSRNPVAAMHNPEFLKNTPQHIIDQAKEVSRVTNNFLGMPTDTSVRLKLFKDKISNAAFDTNSRVLKFADERLLHMVKDPSTYFRSLAFHSKLGLFNPVQMFVQAQAVTQIASIGGVKEAYLGGAGYMLTHGLSLTADPKMLKAASKKAEVMGWNRKDFELSHQALMDSGDDIVGGSNAVRDNLEGLNITGGGAAKFFKHSTYFYNKGEQLGKVIGWHTAFQNWRKLNPTGKFDSEAIDWVRLRASDLTNNMTRDMNATWQRGFMSVPTQFWGFQARMFEQMIGAKSRLTLKERARLFGGMSLMYGMPVGMGAATQFYNVRESVDEYILENKLQDSIDSNLFAKALTEGIMTTSISMLSGLEVSSTRLGPAGNPALQDFFNGDKEWYETFLGPAGSMLGRMMSKSIPMIGAMIDSTEDTVDKASMFSIDPLTLIKNLEVSSVSNAVKLVEALNIAKFVSNNGTELADAKPSEAIALFLGGFEPKTLTRMYTGIRIKKARQQVKLEAKKQALQEFKRARDAIERKDTNAWKIHMSRAKQFGVRGGLTSREKSRVLLDGFFGDSISESVAKDVEDIYRTHQNQVRAREAQN